jgi:hypothetical protein
MLHPDEWTRSYIEWHAQVVLVVSLGDSVVCLGLFLQIPSEDASKTEIFDES